MSNDEEEENPAGSNWSVDTEEDGSPRTWWFVRRLPCLDLVRVAGVATAAYCLYMPGVFALIYPAAILVLYDIVVLILLCVTNGKDWCKSNVRYCLLFYTLAIGFPVGSYTKLALC